jgi:hypothetical protein
MTRYDRCAMSIIRIASLVAVLVVGVATEATAFSFKDISGKWCSEAGDYNFRRDTLVATFHDGTPTRRFKVTSYEYSSDTVTMYWLYKGGKLYTEFSEFSADGRTMAQLEGESGPLRAFRRC